MENLRNSIREKLLSSEKDFLKFTSKPSYMSHKIFDNNLVAIRKSKLALNLNKPAYIGMCTLELSNELIYEFHYDDIKNKYESNSKLFFTDADSLIYEIKTDDVYEDFSSDKEMLCFSHYFSYYYKSKYYDDSNKSIISKIKDETGGVVIKEFIGLKPKMYLFLVDNSEHKKGKGVNRYVVAIISHIDVFLNNKCLRQSMN